MKTLMTSLFLLFLSANIFAGTPYAVGDYAKDFNLKNVHGDYVSMKNIDAKGFIVIFSCNHCPFVVNSEERMIKLHNKYAPKGFPIIAINPNDEEIVPEDSYENMIIRAEERDFPFEYVYDETQEVAKAYGATHTPQVFLLVRENDKFKVVYTGAIDDSPRFPERVEEKFLEAALNNLLNGKKPDPNTTRAVGCSIKWSKN